MSLHQALIIFVKNPILGKVKTRLAKTIGDKQALFVYHRLLQLTHKATAELSVRKFVFYTDFIDEQDLWENDRFQKQLQIGSDLGERMRNAFALVLAEPHIEQVVIIGSDCPDLNFSLLNQAFEALEKHDAVVGPAHDGGYYLLGINQLFEPVFQHKQWSTSSVLTDTIKDLHVRDKTYYLLDTLSDLDEEKDLVLLPIDDTFAY